MDWINFTLWVLIVVGALVFLAGLMNKREKDMVRGAIIAFIALIILFARGLIRI